MDKTNFSKTRNSKTSTLCPALSNSSSSEHFLTKGNDNKTTKRHSFPLMGPPPTKKAKSVKFRQSKAAEKINESTGMKSFVNGNDNIVCTVGSIICKVISFCNLKVKLMIKNEHFSCAKPHLNPHRTCFVTLQPITFTFRYINALFAAIMVAPCHVRTFGRICSAHII